MNQSTAGKAHMDFTIRRASAPDAGALAQLAVATFPLACPPDSPAEDIAAFIAANLGPAQFTAYLADPARVVFVAQAGPANGSGRLLAYTMLVDVPPSDADVAAVVPEPDTLELSKFYALPETHGLGIGGALMEAGISWAAENGDRPLWLGVNTENQRARKFYTKHGFSIAGSRSFQLGNRVEHDHVMVRPRGTKNTG